MNINILADNPKWYWYFAFAGPMLLLMGLIIVIWKCSKKHRWKGKLRRLAMRERLTEDTEVYRPTATDHDPEASEHDLTDKLLYACEEGSLENVRKILQEHPLLELDMFFSRLDYENPKLSPPIMQEITNAICHRIQTNMIDFFFTKKIRLHCELEREARERRTPPIESEINVLVFNTNPFLEAARCCEPDTFKIVCESNFGLLASRRSRAVALFLAIHYGKVENARLLLDYERERGQTPAPSSDGRTRSVQSREYLDPQSGSIFSIVEYPQFTVRDMIISQNYEGRYADIGIMDYSFYPRVRANGDIMIHTPLGVSCFYGPANLVSALNDTSLFDCTEESCGRTAVELAVKGGDADILRLLLGVERLPLFRGQSDTSFSLLDKRQPHTALHTALLERSPTEILDLLIADGYEIEKVAPNILITNPTWPKVGATPLMIAASTGDTEAFELLLSKGAETLPYGTGEFYRKQWERPCFGWTALHVAACFGQLGIINRLFKHDATSSSIYRSQLLHAKTNDGNTPLHIAATFPDLQHGFDIVKSLIEAHAAPKTAINIKNTRGDTPFHLSVASLNLQAVKALIECTDGAVNFITQNGEGKTALHLIAERWPIAKEQLLVSLPVGLEFPDPDPAVQWIARVLTSSNASQKALHIKDDAGCTPLFASLAFKNLNVFAFLLGLDGTNRTIFEKDNAGDSAFHQLARVDDKHFSEVFTTQETRKSLQSRLQDFIHAAIDLNNEGYSALHVALNERNIESAIFLMTICPKLIDIRSASGYTPLQAAVQSCTWSDNGQNVAQAILFQAYDEGTSLVKHGKSSVGTDRFTSLMHIAAEYLALDVARLLIKSEEPGAFVNSKDIKGRTPAHLVFESWTEDKIAALNMYKLNDKRQKKFKNGKYLKSLFLYEGWNERPRVWSLRMEIWRCLVTVGAKADERDDDGRTVIDMVRQLNHLFPYYYSASEVKTFRGLLAKAAYNDVGTIEDIFSFHQDSSNGRAGWDTY